MSLKFTKMHGLGNDFMVVDAVQQKFTLSADLIRKLSSRHTGIGFDQCLLLESPTDKNSDFSYRIFNADGQEVGQCGNGARCLARFIHHYRLSSKKSLRVTTKTTTLDLLLNDDDSVTIVFAAPDFIPANIPLNFPQQQVQYPLNFTDSPEVLVHAVNVGNPHAVMKVEVIAEAPVSILGEKISHHPAFPEQVNAGFMQIISDRQLCLRVYERGAGETRACGSGAVAAAAIGRQFYQMDEKIRVSLPGGDLEVEWPDNSATIMLKGPAVFVYEGQLF